MSAWAMDLCKISENDERKDGIGYFPGSVNNMHETLIEYLKLMAEPTKLQNIIEYSKEIYGIKDSSVRSFMTPLKNIGFIEQISKTDFQITEIAKRLCFRLIK